MSSNWVTALDALAAGGVIDFDAPAYLLDQPARYSGRPKFSDLPSADIPLLPDDVKMKKHPHSDEFAVNNKNYIQNPKWKKWTFAGVLAGAVAAIILMAKGKKVKMPEMKNLKSFGSKFLEVLKKPFAGIANKFKK